MLLPTRRCDLRRKKKLHLGKGGEKETCYGKESACTPMPAETIRRGERRNEGTFRLLKKRERGPQLKSLGGWRRSLFEQRQAVNRNLQRGRGFLSGRNRSGRGGPLTVGKVHSRL